MSRKRRPLAALGLIAIVALISACGSSAPAGTGTGSRGSNDTAANHEKAVKFSECMRANGVSEFPDPGASGTLTLDGIANGSSLNLSTPAWKRAIGACKRLEPTGFVGHKRSTQQQQAALKFAQCMRENGVPDFPDPTPNGPLIDTGRIPSAAGRGARSIPGFDVAAHKCTAIYSGELGLRSQ
jgi:hypothetical protein